MKIIKSKETQIRHLKQAFHKKRKDIKALTDIGRRRSGPKPIQRYAQVDTRLLNHPIALCEEKSKRSTMDFTRKSIFTCIIEAQSHWIDFLRKFVALPSKRTILSLLAKVPFSAGINKHIFQHIDQCIITHNDRYVALLFDEMDIKEQFVYDKKSDRILGYEDYGSHIEGRPTVANKALVFMVCGLGDKKLKQPVSYYFSHGGCNSDTMRAIIEEVLLACHTIGHLEVVTTICDMSTTNVKALTNLGATIETPYFMFHNKKIFIMFDPPHLLKRTASLFREHNITIPVEIGGQHVRMEASFVDIRRAYEKDNANPLVLIRTDHLQPKVKWTTKVNIAAHTQPYCCSIYIHIN